MAKVKENKRNLSSWGIIVQEPQSDHVLRRIFFCKSSIESSIEFWQILLVMLPYTNEKLRVQVRK